MCGVAGFFSDSSEIPSGRLQLMVSALRHRGPDGEGLFLCRRRQDGTLGRAVEAGTAGLGHARLSILDLSADAAEPMSNEDGAWWLTFNGEIYNHRALRAELERDGHRFRSHCDAEVLLHGWEQHGPAFFPRLRGMFAFGLLDLARGELWLARDTLGIKPLFTAHVDGVTAFASELSALEAGGFTGSVSRAAVEAFVALGFVPAPLAMFEGARKLLPGEVVRVRDGRVETVALHAPPLPPSQRERTGALNAIEAQVLDVLRDSVRAHLVSDVEVGVLLSGGIDSAVVTAAMVDAHDGPVSAFTLAIDDPALDETELATHAARTLGVRHHVRRLSADDARARLPGILSSLDEPQGDPSVLPTRLVAELAREHVKVVLSGDGGDELFLGYPRHHLFQVLQRSRALGPLAASSARLAARLPPATISGVYGALHGLFGLPPVHAPARKLAAAAHALGEDRELAYGRLFRTGQPDELTSLGLTHDPAVPLLRAAAAGTVELDAPGLAQVVDLRMWLPDDILTKVDRAGMAVGLEMRVPLVDMDVVRMAHALPRHALREGARGKIILRRLAEKRFGPGLARAGKRGFGLPLRDWFRGPLQGFCTEALASLGDRGFFPGAALRDLQRTHEAGADHAPLLFSLCALEMWLRARPRVTT